MARSARTRVIAATTVVLAHVAVLVVLLAPGGDPIDVRARGFSICLCVAIVPTQRFLARPVHNRREIRSATVVPVVPVVPVVAVEQPANTAQLHPVEPRALDLRVPADVLADVPAAPAVEQADGPGWVFDRKLVRQLNAARTASAQRALLASRRRVHDGTSSDEYARSSALGEKLKTDAGCFELRPDPDNGGTRWWAEACTDTRKSPWEQTALPEQVETLQ